MNMSLKGKLFLILEIITIFGNGDADRTKYCPNGFHPYTIGFSCVYFHVHKPLNYSALLTEVQQYGSHKHQTLVLAQTPTDVQTLSAYAAFMLDSLNNDQYPLWISCQDCYDQECNDTTKTCLCPALKGKEIELVDCSLELGYIMQQSFDIQNVSAIFQDPIYVPPGRFLLEVPVPFNGSDYSITWTLNDEKLNLSMLIAPNNSLQFQNFTEELVGIYKAFVSKGFNRAIVYAADLRQAVLVPPQPLDVTIPKGNLAAFECISPSSRPLPTITWFDSSLNPIVTGGRFFVSPLGTLYIRDASMDDSGMYYCRMNNTAGSVLIGAELEVLNTTMDEDVLLARFIQTPLNQTILKGENATLECSATSNHVVTSDRLNVITNYLFEAGDSFVNTIVYLPTVNSYPSIQYHSDVPVEIRCQAQITVSTPTYGMLISIMSNYSMVTPNVRAAITSISSPTSVPLGEPVSLTCTFTGTPAPQVQWYFNGNPYNNSYSNSSLSTVLISIFGLEDAGTFQCIVVNVHSIAVESVTLSPKGGIPKAVDFTTMLINNKSQVHVTWNPPAIPTTLSPILIHYSVVWRVATQTSEEEITVPHTVFNHTIDVQRGLTYDIGVSIISLDGQGPIVYVQVKVPELKTSIQSTGLSISVSHAAISTTVLSTSSITEKSDSSSIVGDILTSNEPISPDSMAASEEDSVPVVVLSVVLSMAVLVIVAISVCFVMQCFWWRTQRTRGNYSPSKIEEQHLRKAMISVESKPISPLPPLSPSSTQIQSLFSSNSQTSDDVGSELSVEVIRIDRLHSSKDDLSSQPKNK